MAKNVQIGSVMVSDDKNGNKRISIGLGRKNKPPYQNNDVTVEVLVKDSTGKVLARQTDGFLNLVDPRTQPDELLKLGLVSEETAGKMRASAAKLPEKIKYQVVLPRS